MALFSLLNYVGLNHRIIKELLRSLAAMPVYSCVCGIMCGYSHMLSRIFVNKCWESMAKSAAIAAYIAAYFKEKS